MVLTHDYSGGGKESEFIANAAGGDGPDVGKPSNSEKYSGTARQIGKGRCTEWGGGYPGRAREPLGVDRIVTEYVRQLGGMPEATVLAGSFQIVMPHAAFANCTMAHALRFDNTWYPRNHPTSATLPAILGIDVCAS